MPKFIWWTQWLCLFFGLLSIHRFSWLWGKEASAIKCVGERLTNYSCVTSYQFIFVTKNSQLKINWLIIWVSFTEQTTHNSKCFLHKLSKSVGISIKKNKLSQKEDLQLFPIYSLSFRTCLCVFWFMWSANEELRFSLFFRLKFYILTCFGRTLSIINP